MDDEMNTGGSPAPETAPAPEAPAADTGTPDAGSQAAEQPAEESHAPEVAIQVDPQTGKRRVVFPAQEQAETQPPAGEQTQEQAPQTPQETQAPQQYSANDIVQLVATGQQIDPARVPQELQGYAAAIQQQRINAAQAAPARKESSYTGRDFESKEERAERQRLIVRQSCLAQAVATLSVGVKSPPTVADVLSTADQYVAWVTDAPDLFDTPNDLEV